MRVCFSWVPIKSLRDSSEPPIFGWTQSKGLYGFQHCWLNFQPVAAPGIYLFSAAERRVSSGRMTERHSIDETPDGNAPIPIRPKEIRVRWSVIGRKNLEGKPINAGLWFPDSPTFRRDLEVLVESGNFAYGKGTHWIEEREA